MARRLVTGLFLAGIAGLGAVASVAAGERREPFSEGSGRGGFHARWNALTPEDREAFTDARIAALRAGIKLTPDQEKLWPPVETAIRDLARQQEAGRQAMRDRRERMREDAPAALRAMADAASARGDALRKLADATAPLYATLDEGQKRRAMVLARPLRPGFGRHRGWRHREKDDD